MPGNRLAATASTPPPAAERIDGFTAAFLFLLAAFHAAAYSLPGRAYFALTGLSDAGAPLGFNALLHPAFVLCAVYAMHRALATRTSVPRRRMEIVTIGLGAWAVAATLSTIANYDTENVLVTYVVVFVAGGIVYLTVSGIRPSYWAGEALVLGTMAGALFPLLAGISAYVQEWGAPDWTILMNATLDLTRMQPYEAATFGNRGNTAAFLMLIGPPVLWLALDSSRPRARRLLYALLLIPVGINLVLIQVRAALVTSLIVGALVWRFRTGTRLAYVAFSAATILGIALVFSTVPLVDEVLSERFAPILTIDTEDDASLRGRSESILEGIEIGKRHWLLGIGPGGALTTHSQTSAHQLQVQQVMETGVLGFAGCVTATLGIFGAVLMTLGRSQDPATRSRFGLLIGPLAFFTYGVLANLTLNLGYVNTWAVLVASMLALARRPRWVTVTTTDATSAQLAAQAAVRRPVSRLARQH